MTDLSSHPAPILTGSMIPSLSPLTTKMKILVHPASLQDDVQLAHVWKGVHMVSGTLEVPTEMVTVNTEITAILL